MAPLPPIVVSTTGCWGPSATMMYKRLASMIAEKYRSHYNTIIMKTISCKIAFSLVDSAIMCIRGAQSLFHHRHSKLV